MTQDPRTALTVRHVHKRFDPENRDPVVALADITLDVSEGEFLVLLGASGCGKSTLLRLFAGLELPTSGEVALFGERVTKPSPDVGFMFQSSVLLPWRTVKENVMLPAEIQRRTGPEWEERASSLLATTGLEGFANAYPRELSGGMRQRAAICRALLLDPEILLMDEPFGALDAITRSGLNRELFELWRRTRKTIVFVTHDISEGLRLGSRVIVMTPRPGRIAHVNNLALSAESYDERVGTPEYAAHLRELERQIEESSTAGAAGPEDARLPVASTRAVPG
jgi:NitT/TauT family transport system ATP-binding protein